MVFIKRLKSLSKNITLFSDVVCDDSFDHIALLDYQNNLLIITPQQLHDYFARWRLLFEKF